MKSQLMNQLKVILLYVFFAVIITLPWQWYELKVYGYVKPDVFDSIIAVILALSLTFNVLSLMRSRPKKSVSNSVKRGGIS